MSARPFRLRQVPVVAALDFQDDLERLVAEPAPLILRLWPMLGAALLVGLVGLAASMSVDMVVVATGRLAADAPPVMLQPMNRAVLRELAVHPGDLVVAGQLLARLDPTIPEADRASLLVEQRALRAEAARLEADLSGQLLAASDPDRLAQAGVQAGRTELADARRGALRAEITALTEALAAETAAGPGLADRLAIARDVEAMRLELAARQIGSRLATLEAKAARLDVEAALRQHEARRNDLTQRIAAARAGLAAFDLDLRRDGIEALASLRPRLAQLDAQLAKANRLSALSDLRAPINGVVLSVAAGGPGSMMREGEPVVVLVPTDVALIAEVGIRSADAGTISVGDPVAVKVDAFPWRKFGMLSGRLADVSHASFTPDGSVAALHSGRVTLSGGLSGLPPGGGLLPGMTISAEIKTGTRSVLDYFLDPLLRGLTESLREP